MQDLYDKQEKEKITRALEEMKTEAGDGFSFEKVNLAELERRSGVSRQRLRRLKKNNFEFLPHGNTGKVSPRRGLEGFTGTINALIMSGITNSSVWHESTKLLIHTRACSQKCGQEHIHDSACSRFSLRKHIHVLTVRKEHIHQF